MTTNRSLVVGLALAIVASAIAPLLGENGGAAYTKVMHPLLLFLSAFMSAQVSFMYRSQMRRLFVSLAVFLLLYGIVTVSPVIDSASDALKDSFLRALLGYQLLTYAFLLVAGFAIFRLTGLRRISSVGQLVLAVIVIFAVVIVARSFPTFNDIAESSDDAAALYLVIRILDVVAMLLVFPALILFVQKSKSKHQESLSFSIIGAGIILSLVAVYAYELAIGEPLSDFANSDYQQGSFLDAVYIFGYATLGVGMLIHWRHQVWSFRQLEKMLGVDEKTGER